MKVFLSWSGDRSRYIAEAFRSWLPKVIQAIDPWMSKKDIAAGMRWSSEVASELEETSVGIIFVTPENQHKPWIMFEAGALSKTLPQSFVCPYLFDITSSQVSGPLAQFQAAEADKGGTLDIVKALNAALGANSLVETTLEESFSVWWPSLEGILNDCPNYDDEKIEYRSTEDMLSELLWYAREQLRREELRYEKFVEKADEDPVTDSFVDLFEEIKNYIPRHNHLAKLATPNSLERPVFSVDVFNKLQEELVKEKEANKEFDRAYLDTLKKPEAE